MTPVAFSLTVNGAAVTATVEPRTHLADFLREQLLLTGTHLGCEHGVCGACTILLDGEPARACIVYAATCGGRDVRTIEGLADDSIAAAHDPRQLRFRPGNFHRAEHNRCEAICPLSTLSPYCLYLWRDFAGALLPGQSMKDLPQLTARLSKQYLAPSLGDEHHLVFAIPF